MNMNLTPEEREIGKQNFYAAVGSEHTRRDFLKQSLAAAVVGGGGLAGFYFGYSSIKDPLRVGVIGTGDEGNVLIGAMNPSYLQVVAIADIRPYSVYRAFHGEVAQPARPGLMTVYGWDTEQEARKHVKVYTGDYRELFKDSSVEAVVIALPLHLHAKVAIEAMMAGKHVLTEKLMGRTVAQCKEMARYAETTGKILAVGHQRHYNVLYDNAKDTIERGLLGDIHYIRAQWHRVKDTWKPGLPPGTRKLPAGAKPEKGEPDLLKTQASWKRRLEEAKKVRDSEEIDLWTKKLVQLEKQMQEKPEDGPPLDSALAAKYDYRGVEVKDPAGKVRYQAPPLEELIRWRLWNRTGAGIMAELGSHQLDAASIFIAAAHAAAAKGAKGAKQPRLVHPLSVSAVANRNLYDWDREIEDHLSCLIEFPAPGYNEKDALGRLRTITVAYASINGNGYGGYGECVFGTKGTLLLEEEKQALLYPTESDTSVVSTKIEVKKKPDKDAVLDTQASPGSAQAAGAAALGGEVSRGYREELEHWAWCIRNPDPKNKPRCHPEVALKDAVIALTTNVAAQTRRIIKFDEAWFDSKSDATPDDSKIDLTQYKAP